MFGTISIFISTTETDIGSRVTFYLVLRMGLVVACEMLWAIIFPLMVI